MTQGGRKEVKDMSNIWGRNLRLSIFGESHGEGIGIVIDGLPAGFAPDMSKVEEQMARRLPGASCPRPAKKQTGLKFSVAFTREGLRGHLCVE